MEAQPHSKQFFKSSIFSYNLQVLFLMLFFTLANNSTLLGQIVYTDQVPDFRLNGNASVSVDINNDEITDLTFVATRVQEDDMWIYKINIFTSASCKVAVSNESASVLQEDEIIDVNLNWSGQDEVLMLVYAPGWGQSGNWMDVDNGFVGIRIYDDEQIYYAWIRVNASPLNKLWIVDWAYESIADTPIIVGDGLPTEATSVFGKDNYDYFDGRDIKASFTRAHDESNFSEYRIMIAKATDTSAYNLDVMNLVPEERYISFIIESLDTRQVISQYLSADAVDINGNALDKLVDYRLHLLNIASSGDLNENILSVASPIFMLQAFTQPVDHVVGWDCNDNNSADDICVSFSPTSEELYIGEYRIFVALDSDTNSLTLETALSISDEYYSSILPSDTTSQIILNSDQFAIDGSIIKEGIYYKVYVLSVADSIFSLGSALSQYSRKFSLNNPSLYRAGQQLGDHVNYFSCDSLFSNPCHWVQPSVQIDVNRDGLIDYTLYWDYSESTYYLSNKFDITPERDNMVLICDHEDHENWVDILNENHAISEDHHWTNENAILHDSYYSSWGGNYFYGHYFFYNMETYVPIYVGLKIMDNENPQYAWIHINQEFFISYGFQDINSGTTQEPASDLFRVFPNPSNDFIYIQTSITNMSKQEFSVAIINSMGFETDRFKTNEEIIKKDIKDYSAGLYFLVFYQNNRIIEKQRFIVQ